MNGFISQEKKTLKIRMLCLGGRVIWRSLLVLVTLVVMVSPSCIGSSESPVGRIGKGQVAHVQSVEAGQEEDESAEGVQEGHHRVDDMAGQEGWQRQTQERGGQHKVESGMDEEAREAGEDAEDSDGTEEGDGGVGGDGGEVEEARCDCLEQL